MEPTAQFGSGSPLLGGTSGLARSMLGSNMLPQGAALTQESPASPNYDPALSAPANPPMPNGSPVADMHLQQYMKGMNNQAPAAPAPQPQAPAPMQVPEPQMQPPVSEAELIIKAMTDRLKHMSKKDEHILGMNAPKLAAAV